MLAALDFPASTIMPKPRSFGLKLTDAENERLDEILALEGWGKVEMLTRLMRGFLRMTPDQRLRIYRANARNWTPAEQEQAEPDLE